MAAGKLRLHLIVAVAQNQGIGYEGALPWPRIGTDMKFMAKKTTDTIDSTKQNAVVMGRNTWESIPSKNRPLKNRFNIVLSTKPSSELPPGPHMVCPSLSDVISNLETPPLSDKIENVFVLGGSSVYSEVMHTPYCGRIYMTEVLAVFPADTFFPDIDTTVFTEIEDPTIPKGTIEENGVKFRFKNAVIFGRRTWEFLIREEGRKYANRFNVVLTTKPLGDIPPGADLVCTSLQGALDRLQTPPLSHHIQQVFILGGRRLYEEAMRHEMCDRLYVTVLDGVFPADVYHPPIDHTLFTSITCDDVPQGQYTENGITYRFTVYQRL